MKTIRVVKVNPNNLSKLLKNTMFSVRNSSTLLFPVGRFLSLQYLSFSFVTIMFFFYMYFSSYDIGQFKARMLVALYPSNNTKISANMERFVSNGKVCDHEGSSVLLLSPGWDACPFQGYPQH